MPKVELKVGDLVRKSHLGAMESGILLQRHESYWDKEKKHQVPVMWSVFGWTKPRKALDSMLKRGIAEGRIIHAPIKRNE